MGISVNGPSGIDTQYIIDSLVSIEQEKVTKIENEKSAYQVKIDAYSKLKSYLSAISSKAAALSKTSSFDLFNSTSSDENVATIKGGTGSVDAKYDLKVFQLAGSEKMVSADGKIADQNASLSSLGITTGDISIDGVTISLGVDDTLQDLRMKINNATTASGGKLGVTASVLKISDNNFRLVLSSKETGADGIEYKDLTGSTLQDLGIIFSADGDKGNTNQQVTSSGDVLSAFDSLSVGEAIQFTGTDRDGKTVVGTFVKRAGSTSDDFLNAVSTAYHNMADAAFDASGNLVITDKVSGTSALSMNSLTAGANTFTSSLSEIGTEGSGVLSVGKDAYFSVENIFMSSETNSASGFVTGVTFEFKGVSSDKSVALSLKRDNDGIKGKFQDLVNAYNELLKFSKDNTKFADPNDSNSTRGNLAGDMTINSIVSQVRSYFQQSFKDLGGAYSNFTMVGLKTNTSTGEYEIDGEMFNKALEKGFEDVVNLFTTVGNSDNPNVILGRSTKDTKSGKYSVEEVDSQFLRIQLQGSTEWYTSDARKGDIVSFSNGPAMGLSLTASTGSIGTGSTNFTFSKGLTTLLDEAISNLNDSHDGMVSLRQETWRRGIDMSNDRIEDMNARIDSYRERLVKQFSKMEQAMSQMQSQSSNMMSQLS